MRIQVEGLSRRPGVDGIDIAIDDGETLALVGPSGCGKSTLLRLIAGLDQPDSGTIRYDGHDVADVAPQDRGIGMVFQDYALYPTMKGKGNLSYFFEVHQRTEAEAEQRAREIADIMGVGFEVLLGKKPTTLSGGEQQRVAIARCIVRDPTLFLMDEPICNLDAKLREQTRMEIKKLLRRFGITTVYVTHDQQEAIFMGDRIAVLRAGRVEQIGSFDDLYYSPANLFVAGFIGTRPMAVFPVAVEGNVVRVDESSWTLPLDLAGEIPGGTVRLGVRPEDWSIDANGAPAPVERVERIPTEHLTLAHCRIGGVRATVVAPRDIAEDDVLLLTPQWDRVSFFEAAGERVLRTPGIPDFF